MKKIKAEKHNFEGNRCYSNMSLTVEKGETTPTKLDQNVALQAYCLRWNHFQSNMLEVFERLFLDERFVDVTLACEGHLIKAHKVVLSASSAYFQEIFTTTPCPHPVIIMKDVQLKDLRKILEFMYKGEINVRKQEIAPLLVVAEALHVKGLVQFDTDNNEPQPSTSTANEPNEMRTTAKVNRLLKRKNARESSTESLVLIEDDQGSQTAKQIKLNNESSTKSSVQPQDNLIDEMAYTSTHEADDDFLEHANVEYDNSGDSEPIAIESVQIKHEQEDDVVTNYITDNGVSETFVICPF